MKEMKPKAWYSMLIITFFSILYTILSVIFFYSQYKKPTSHIKELNIHL